MVKKFIAGIFIILILFTSGTTCYATNRVKTRDCFFEVLAPEKDTVITDRNILLSFKASRGTNVRIEVYYNSSMEEEKEKYVLYCDPIDITVGVLQRGWASVDLKSGLNKIQFTTKYRDGSGDSMERIINVMEVKEVKQLFQDIVNRSNLGIWKKR